MAQANPLADLGGVPVSASSSGNPLADLGGVKLSSSSPSLLSGIPGGSLASMNAAPSWQDVKNFATGMVNKGMNTDVGIGNFILKHLYNAVDPSAGTPLEGKFTHAPQFSPVNLFQGTNENPNSTAAKAGAFVDQAGSLINSPELLPEDLYSTGANLASKLKNLGLRSTNAGLVGGAYNAVQNPQENLSQSFPEGFGLGFGLNAVGEPVVKGIGSAIKGVTQAPSMLASLFKGKSGLQDLVTNPQYVNLEKNPSDISTVANLLGLQERFPSPLTTPEMFSDPAAKMDQQNYASKAYPSVESRYSGIASGVGSLADASTAALSPGQTPGDLPSDLQKLIEDDYTSAKKTASNKYDALFDAANQPNNAVTVTPNQHNELANNIYQKLQSAISGSPLFSKDSSFMDNLGKIKAATEQGPVDYPSAINITKNYNNLASQAYQGGNTELGKNLSDLKNAFEKDMLDSAKQQSPGLYEAHKDAQQYYKNNVAPYLQKKPVNVYNFSGANQLSDPGNLVTKIFSGVKKGQDPVDSLNQVYNLPVFQNNPDAKNLLTLGYLNKAFQGDDASPAKLVTLFNNIGSRSKDLMFQNAPQSRQMLEDLSTLKTSYPEMFNYSFNPKTGARNLGATQDKIQSEMTQAGTAPAKWLTSKLFNAMTGNMAKKIAANYDQKAMDLSNFYHSPDFQKTYYSQLLNPEKASPQDFYKTATQSPYASDALKKAAQKLLNKETKTVSQGRMQPITSKAINSMLLASLLGNS